jgi:tryptophanyl-tRNA synthetase
MKDREKKVVLSGMRPTAGRLHLGNYHGALKNWVELQDRYRCFFFIADWHALSTMYADTARLRENIRELALDYLAAGLDPERSVIFVQSEVKEHAELHLLFSMFVPLGWLLRVPTYKEQLRQPEGRDLATYGFLGYPVLQAADITIYKADYVPVGQDQLPHLELTREIVRRFNHLYRPVFPEPQALLTEAPVLPGIDGRKMSKSYNNYIPLGAEREEIERLVMAMVTDPQRVKRTDPGDPQRCQVVYAFHRLYSAANLGRIEEGCREAKLGCVECKRLLAQRIEEEQAPIRERRRELARDPERVERLLAQGAERAREVARKTLAEAREAIGLA